MSGWKKKVVGVLAAVATVATMGLTAVTANAADEVGADATANANIYQALEYMQDLNTLRARDDRRALTPQQIANAYSADNNTTVSASLFAENTGDGKPVGALKVNDQMMSWAQTRANELAKRAVTNPNNPLSHDNMTNGRPSWGANNLTNSNNGYQPGTFVFGPEALAIGYPDYDSSMEPVNSWYSELNVEFNLDQVRKDNPQYANMTDAQILQYERQGYGHYLTEVSPLADIAGFGVAKVSGGQWDGALVSVLEIGNSKTAQGKTQSVEEALKEYAPKKTITGVKDVTLDVDSSTTKPTLPAKVTATYDDKSTAQVPVTWESVPNDWNKDRDAHKVTIKGQVDSWSKGVTLTLNVAAATITSAIVTPNALSTPAGVDPTDKLPKSAAITWSNGETGTADVKWDDIGDQYKTAGKMFTLNGTASNDGQTAKVSLTITVGKTEAVSAEATPASVDTIAGTKPKLDDINATVTYTDGSTTINTVKWDAIDASKYANEGTFTATGTVLDTTVNARAAGNPLLDKDGKQLTVKVTVNVKARAITAVTATSDITIDSAKTAPDNLTGSAIVKWNDGTTETRTGIKLTLPDGWNTKRESHIVTATGRVADWDEDVPFNVTVKAATIESVEDPADRSTTEGVVPPLPESAKVTWSNGDSSSEPVVWNEPENFKDLLDKAGDTVTVNGAIKGYPDKKVTVKITVTAATIESVTAPKDVTIDAGDKLGLPDTVTAKLSNGNDGQVSVTWKTDGVDFSNRSGKDKTVTVKGEIAGY
ncbi:Ig-like domain-containing protein [Bifidobacterium primatium]|nr:Ig-like domain-containing protein [Bifidobacterium primatium]